MHRVSYESIENLMDSLIAEFLIGCEYICLCHARFDQWCKENNRLESLQIRA